MCGIIEQLKGSRAKERRRNGIILVGFISSMRNQQKNIVITYFISLRSFDCENARVLKDKLDDTARVTHNRQSCTLLKLLRGKEETESSINVTLSY